MSDSWVSDYLRSKESDIVDDPQAYWEAIVSDYRSLFGFFCRRFRYHDGRKLADTVVPGSHEQGTLFPYPPVPRLFFYHPRFTLPEHYIDLNEQNIVLLANAYFDMASPNRRRGTRCVGEALDNGEIQSSARACAIVDAGRNFIDGRVVGLARGLFFLRKITCAQRYIASQRAAEEYADGELDAGVHAEGDYVNSDLGCIENISQQLMEELASSLANLDYKKFIFSFRSGYRVFVRE